ncbi:uncharacterized protein LOC144000388 isoform X2 [Lithobates pipiens]
MICFHFLIKDGGYKKSSSLESKRKSHQPRENTEPDPWWTGRENVIVVIDDFENTSDEEKDRILETQPSIGQYARDFFLFSSTLDKRNSPNSQKNLKEIKHIIKAHNRRLPCMRFGEILIKYHRLVILGLIICGLLLLIISLVAFGIQQSTVPLTTASPWNITANTTTKT